jgi:hypothetical protein
MTIEGATIHDAVTTIGTIDDVTTEGIEKDPVKMKRT